MIGWRVSSSRVRSCLVLGVLSVIPAAAQQAARRQAANGAATTTAVFAHVAIGDGYTTVFTFMNTGATALIGNLILTDDSGKPLTVSLVEPSGFPLAPSEGRMEAVGSSLSLSINAGGTLFLAAGPAAAGDPARKGWARVESDGGTLGGVATFQYSPGGTLQTIAGVLASSPVEAATIPVDNDASSERYTGFALANPGDSLLTVRVVPVDQNGVAVPGLSLSIPLAAGSQTATFLHQVWQTASALSFQGSVVLMAPAGRSFAVVALVQNQGLLSATPVIPSKAPAIN
jgi:hypothetical protein